MDPYSVVAKVGVLVSKFGKGTALDGFAGFCDWVGLLVNPNENKVQNWLTHFALVLELENWEVWRCERLDWGISHLKIDKPVTWEWHVWQGSERLCNISLSSIDYRQRFLGKDVTDYVQEQQQFEYNIVTKNCKHFVYDFFVFKVQHRWIKDMHFQSGFSEMIEQEFAKVF